MSALGVKRTSHLPRDESGFRERSHRGPPRVPPIDSKRIWKAHREFIEADATWYGRAVSELDTKEWAMP